MTIKCVFETCKWNNAGFCRRDEVELASFYSDRGEETDALDCRGFEWAGQTELVGVINGNL